MSKQVLEVAGGKPTDVVVMAVCANYDIVPRSILVQWLVLVISNWITLNEIPQGCEFNGWILGCAATASVDQHQVAGKEFRVDEWVLFPSIIFADDKGCVVESSYRETGRRVGRRHDACLGRLHVSVHVSSHR